MRARFREADITSSMRACLGYAMFADQMFWELPLPLHSKMLEKFSRLTARKERLNQEGKTRHVIERKYIWVELSALDIELLKAGIDCLAKWGYANAEDENLRTRVNQYLLSASRGLSVPALLNAERHRLKLSGLPTEG